MSRSIVPGQSQSNQGQGRQGNSHYVRYWGLSWWAFHQMLTGHARCYVMSKKERRKGVPFQLFGPRSDNARDQVGTLRKNRQRRRHEV